MKRPDSSGRSGPAAPDADPVDRLLAPLRSRGGNAYLGEDVTQAAHALQAADLASQAGASDELVVAALLHDLGWLTGGSDDDHPSRGADLLARWLPPAVSEPVRLHVEAKRWLCADDPAYHAHLSDESKRTLVLQGGPMSSAEVAAWQDRPWTAEAVILRLWDDDAKVPGREVPGFDHWTPMVRRMVDDYAARAV
jgi:gamma-butyrobetaine dioxygenase